MAAQQPACPEQLDASLGPWAGPDCRGGFDFTLFFEESILGIPLQCFLIVIIPLRIYFLSKRPIKVSNGWLAWAKLAASVAWFELNMVLLVLWSMSWSNTPRTSATIPAAALPLVASLGLVILSRLEHQRSFRPSGIAAVYLTISIICDLPRTRTLWLLNAGTTIAGTFSATLGVRIILLVFELIDKRRLLYPEYADAAFDATRSFISELFFTWLIPTFRRGFRRILHLDDIEKFSENMQTKVLHRELAEAWAKVENKEKKNALMYTAVRVYWKSILAIVPAKIFLIALTYAQPFLIDDAVGVAATPQMQPFNNYAYGLIGAFFLVYGLLAVFQGQYAYLTARTVSRVKGGASALLYEKILTLEVVAPESAETAGGILTLSGTDIDTLSGMLAQIHDVWACVVELTIGYYLIQTKLGVACAMPIAVGSLLVIASMGLAIAIGVSMAAWIQASQDRVTATSKVLRSMKCLKISDLTEISFDMLRNLRITELDVSSKYRHLLTASLVVSVCGPIIIPVLTFSLYAGLGQRGGTQFSLQTAFTSLSILTLLNGPLQTVTSALPHVMGGVTSFQRIQNYMNARSREDDRVHATSQQKSHFAAINPASSSHASLGSVGTWQSSATSLKDGSSFKDDSSLKGALKSESLMEVNIPRSKLSVRFDDEFELADLSMAKRPEPFDPILEEDNENPFERHSSDRYTSDRYSEESTPPVSFMNMVGATANNDLVATLQGSFAWSEEEEPAVDIDEWEIRRGLLHFVLGPVGSGKSTLLKALLGELPDFEGTVWTSFNGVAYCAQNPWIPNDTIRHVIIGGGSVDEHWYRKVIQACALTRDIENWPEGDEEMTGAKGISLSGGQKHRLALARAVYARKEVLILDDVFTGLDAAVQHEIFENLLGINGLLRRARQTVILALSNDSRTSYADHVLVLDTRGRVWSSGSPDVVDRSSVAIDPADLEDAVAAAAAAAAEEDSPAAEAAAAKRKSVAVTLAEETLETKEELMRRKGDRSMYWFFIKAAGRRNCAFFAIATIIYAFCGAFPSVWIGMWSGSPNPLQDLGKWLGVYVALGVGGVTAAGIAIWIVAVPMINKFGMHFHDELLRTTANAPMSFYSEVDSGITLNRFSQELQLVDMDLPVAALGTIIALAFTVAQFIVVAVSAKYMAAFLPVVIILLYIMQRFYLRTSRQMRLLDIEHRAPVYSHLEETMEGVITIRAFGWEDRVQDIHYHLLDKSRRPSFMLQTIQSWLNFTLDMVLTGLAVLFIVMTTTLREQIGPQSMGTGLSGILAYSNVQQQFVNSWVQLEIALGAVARIKWFVTNTEPDPDYQGEPLAADTTNWPGRGKIELDNVTASYNSSGKCLQGVTATIEPGQRVAICGRSGSGKSSLTLCLLRLMALDEGTIYVDGLDIARLSRYQVQDNLVALPQEAFIFDATVRKNVDPAELCTDEQIIAALEKVKMWGKVQARGGLDVLIHDEFFSSGESQLVAFARALVRDSKVLILDEFTSSLDVETTETIDQVLRTEFPGWTIISVVHKLKSILDFDGVLVLDKGQMVEYGNPRQLLEVDSEFNRLYQQL